MRKVENLKIWKVCWVDDEEVKGEMSFIMVNYLFGWRAEKEKEKGMSRGRRVE